MFSFKNFLMATLLIFAVSISGIAKAGIITDRLPFYCYVDHKVNTYREPNGQIVGYISADEDLVRVTQVRSDGWAYGDYPISGGKRIARWFRVSELCADPGYSNRGTNVRGAQTVFRLPNSNVQFGSVSNNESVIVLADNGNRAQILYRLNNGQGYKVGWVSSSSVRNGGGNSSGTNIKGDLNNDGKVDNTDADLMKKFIAGYISKSQINISNADMDGDGVPATPADMARLLDLIDDSNNSSYAQPAEGDYYIVPLNSSCAIDVPNNWHNEGNILQIYGQNNMPAQIFTIKRVSNEWYKIIHKDSGNVMNVQGGNNGNGTRLWLYHYDGTASCHWRFRDLGGGVYNIESQLPSNPFLEVQNGNPFNGAILQLWQQHNGNAAKWTLKKATPQPNSKLQELIKKWDGQRWVDHSYSSTSVQCKEFAQYIFNELYGVRGVGSGSTSDNPTNWRLNNIPSSIYKVAEVPENRNATQAKEQFRNLFAQAQPGDFIQIKRGHGGAHSAIFVAHTGSGIQWLDANADNNNGTKLQTYSYDELVATKRKKRKDGTYLSYQWNVAISLYRAKNR